MTTHNFKKGQNVRARDYEDMNWTYGTFVLKLENLSHPYVIEYNNSITGLFRICEPVEDVIVSEWIPKEGELIEVSNDNINWVPNKWYLVCKNKDGYWVSAKSDLASGCRFKYARPIQKELSVKKPSERIAEIYKENFKVDVNGCYANVYTYSNATNTFLDEFAEEINERFNNLTK